MNESLKFKCHYELDQRPDSELVTLIQTSYRLIQRSLGDAYPLRIEDDGLPNAVEYYLLYVAALVYGAADAVLTMVLHNLGREARIIERQIFEYSARAHYFANRPLDARKLYISTPFRERQILDELGYDKAAQRYLDVEAVCTAFESRFPDECKYREPNLRDILGDKEDAHVTALYALFYRVHSQMAHATIAGVGGVIQDEGIKFDSREENPNLSLEAATVLLIGFLELLNEHLQIDISATVQLLRDRLHTIQARLGTHLMSEPKHMPTKIVREQ